MQARGRLDSGDPAAAAEICRQALADAPDDVDLLTLLGAALIGCRQLREAVEPLQRAVSLAPRFPRALEFMGQVLTMLGRPAEALDPLTRARQLEPDSEPLRLKLAHALAASGRGEEADRLYEEAFEFSPEHGRLSEAALHLREGRLEACRATCRAILDTRPEDVNALRLLARVAGENERWGQAERLLHKVLLLAPGFHDARLDLVRVFKHQDRIGEAVKCAGDAVRRSPHNAHARYMLASMLAVAGRHDEALEAYHEAIALRHHHPAAWIGMGHLLKTLGRTEEGIEAYHKAIEQRPDFGEVYWSLANLKTYRFSDAELADMQARLGQASLDEDSRVHFGFAIAKALEDRGDYGAAFRHYSEACRIQRMRVAYDPLETRIVNQRIRETFTPEFLQERSAPCTHEARPVFIIGLPRSGSTLIEQILASHSQCEGTAELPEVGRVISTINGASPRVRYPEALAEMDAPALHGLGRGYLERTRRHRKGLPCFTDKMPNNFPSIGLIHLMLPDAVIIDARRHPLDSCFGSFKQHFAHGQAFSYDFEDIADYYIEYRRMMRHWREVLPGKVLELRYEDLVLNQELHTRRLLEHCGLPFEDACLRFWTTDRPVRTASSEQVRQPIYQGSLNHWRHYATELAPLAELLGEEVSRYESGFSLV